MSSAVFTVILTAPVGIIGKKQMLIACVLHLGLRLEVRELLDTAAGLFG